MNGAKPTSTGLRSTHVDLQPIGERKKTGHDTHDTNVSNGIEVNYEHNYKDNKDNKDNKDKETIGSTATRPPLSRQKSKKLTIRETFCSWRYVIVLLLHFSFVVAIQVRNCMSMAMVCMVDTSNRQASNHSANQTDFERIDATQNGNVTSNEFEFVWDNELQGLILTSISFLSFLGPLLVDAIRLRLGNKLTLTFAFLITSVLNFLTPLAARFSPYLLVAVRSLLGVVILANLPITGDTCAWWAPGAEKQLMVTIIFGGINIGGIISSSVSGLLCQIPFDNGWPFVFYFFGSFTLIWTVAWYFLSSQKPEEHPFISEREIEYIINHRIGMNVDKNAKSVKPPYGVILTSRPVIAFLICGSCHVWVTNVYFTNLPFFFVSGLRFSVIEAGLLMSVISALRFFGMFVWTAITNFMTKKLKIPTTRVRKITICAGFGLAGLSQAVIITMELEQKWVIIGLLFFIMFNQCVGSCVVPVLPLDLAPRYAGFLTGLFYSVGSLFAISGPFLTSVLTPTGSIEEWRIVWILLASTFLIATISFGIIGDASLQPWGAEDADNKTFKVVSPFVSMGRRLSSLFNSSPLTIETPVQSKPSHIAKAVNPVHQLQLDGQLSFQEDSPQNRNSSLSGLDIMAVNGSMEDDDDDDASDAESDVDSDAIDMDDVVGSATHTGQLGSVTSREPGTNTRDGLHDTNVTGIHTRGRLQDDNVKEQGANSLVKDWSASDLRVRQGGYINHALAADGVEDRQATGCGESHVKTNVTTITRM